MRSIWQRSTMIAIVVIIVLGAGAIALARPHPTSEPALGTEWQCNRAAFVVTCNHRRNGAPWKSRLLSASTSGIHSWN